MNTVWLKIVGLAVAVIVGLIILINVFTSSEPEPEPKPEEKGFYAVAEQDKKRLLTEPQPVKEDQNQPADNREATKPVQPAVEPTQLYFKPLSEIETIEAEKLLNVAVPGRSIGRLPMTGFKLMVDNCRQIISRWPDSSYAYKAQQMLIEMPPRFRERYRITEEELDISKFTKPRPGTKPFTFEESR